MGVKNQRERERERERERKRRTELGMDRATRLVSGRARAGVRLCRAYTTGSASTFDPVVTPKWLEEQRNVKILDATWYLPSKKLDGKDDFRKARIPNAQYFDIDAIADKSASLKHMLPPSNAFAAAMDSLNITNSDTVVVYETNGIAFAAARAWWMFRCFGHDDVRVLDGGMPAWRKDGNLALDETVVGSHLINAPGLAAMEAQESGKSDFKYQATLRENLVVSKQDILSDLSKEDNKKFLLDARGEARFRVRDKGDSRRELGRRYEETAVLTILFFLHQFYLFVSCREPNQKPSQG